MFGLDPPGRVEGRLAKEGRVDGRLGEDGFMPPDGRLSCGRDDGRDDGRDEGRLDGRLNDGLPDGRLTDGRLIDGLGRELGRLEERLPPSDGVLGRDRDIDPPRLGDRLGARPTLPRLPPPRLAPPRPPLNPANVEDSVPARIMRTAASTTMDLHG